MHRQDRCHARFYGLLAEGVDGGLVDRWDGVELAVARTPVDEFNTAFVTSAPKERDTLPKLVGRLRDAEVPFTVQVPEPVLGEVLGPLAALGLSRPVTVPGMRVDLADLSPAAHPGLHVVRVDERRRDAWVAAASAGFGMPRDIGELITPPSLLERPGIDVWLGERDGEPVGTAITLTVNGAVGLYAVSVPEELRGVGIGAALSSGAILGASERHLAKEAVLQSTAAGYDVYRRLGFRTVRPYLRFASSARPSGPDARPA